MRRPLIPELHDIAKIWNITEQLRTEFGLSEGVQNEFGRLPSLLGIPEPQTDTWQGICGHHGNTPRSKDIFLLQVADHAGSSLSRGIRGSPASPLGKTVLKLWNPAAQQPLRRLTSKQELRSLIEWLASDPDAQALSREYGTLLSSRPEQLRPPLNVVSLASHNAIVGRIYRFFTGRVASVQRGESEMWSYRNKWTTNQPKSAEKQWKVLFVKGAVAFPQYTTRTLDLAVFDIVAEQMQNLEKDDRILITTFSQFLGLCADVSEIEDLLKPLVDAGLRVNWQAATTPIIDLTPVELRKAARQAGRRASADDSLAYPRGVAIWPLAERIPPPICDVCQLEPATRRWPDDPSNAGPYEQIGERCYSLRQRGTRLTKLSSWTDEASCRVAWIYVDLHLDRLAAFLQPLLTRYAEQYLGEKELEQVVVRSPLLLEFQQDYERFLQDWADSVAACAGRENVEHVGGGSGVAGNTLLCLRLGGDVSVSKLLNLYHQAIQKYFPICFAPDLPAECANSIPFRLYLGVSGVKFPFSEHWRTAQEADADLLIQIVGRGSMRAPLPSLPALVQIADIGNRTALHNLAEVAKISEALVGLHIEDREDQEHYRFYTTAMKAVRPFGMSHQDFVMYAKILEE